MKRIGSWFATACRGEGGLVLLSGEAGIGKSSLCSAFASAAIYHDVLVLTGGCYELTASPAYGPWLEIALAYSGHDNLPPLPDVLRDGSRLDTFDSQPEFFDLVRRFLSTVTEQLPVLLIIEDIHWADQASLDLLRYLSRTLNGHRLLMIATYRDDELAREHPLALQFPALVREGNVHRLNLPRLNSTAVLALVRGRYRLSAADEERLLSYLEERAEGNPFFITELLHTLTDRRLLRPTAGGWELDDLAEAGIPILVQQVIDARLARLEPATRQMLELVAVIGAEPSLDLLQTLQVETTPELDSALQQALDSHMLLLRPERRLQFSHALVRQTIYASIPILRRQELHRQVGEVLVARPNPDLDDVANHLYQAGDKRAISWLLESAERATSLYAPETVIAQCNRAIELADQLGLDLPGAAFRLRGLARELRSDFDGARDDLETTLELARRNSDLRAEWQAVLDLATLWASRDYALVSDYCRQAVELARVLDDPETLGHSLNRLGNWHMNIEQPSEGLPLHHEALSIFKAVGSSHGVGATLDLIATAYLVQGDSTRALHYYEQAIPLLRQINDRLTLASALLNVSALFVDQPNLKATRIHAIPPAVGRSVDQLIDEALSIASDIGSRPTEVFALEYDSIVLTTVGRYEEALRSLRSAQAMAEDIQHQQWRVVALEGFGYIYREIFALDKALKHLQLGLRLAKSINSLIWIRSVSANIALSYVLREEFDKAADLLLGIVDLSSLPNTQALRRCWFVQAEMEFAQGKSASALKVVNALVSTCPGKRGVLSPRLTRLRGDILLSLSRTQEAETELKGSLSVATSLGMLPVQWRVQASLCKLYFNLDRLDAAIEARRAGLAIVEDLAVGIGDCELSQNFLAHARALFPAMPPSKTLRTNGELTKREREVLRLVCDGLTDSQIAENLSISPRTVMTHVSHILTKLDAPNRTAASHLAVERDLL